MRVIDDSGENRGVLSLENALLLAEQAGLDLVEIVPNADPPVARVMNFGKFKYETQKKKSDARKKQKIITVKEIKIRPNIDTHDYEVKERAARRFLEEGNKVKVSMRFRGRENAHYDLGKEVLDRFAEDLSDISKIEFAPKMEGRQFIMVLASHIG